MQWLDIAICAVIGLSVITGLFRGFVKELIALITWILAIWCGFHYSHNLEPWLQSYIGDASVRSGVGFILVLFGTLFVGGVVNTIFSFILKRTGLSGTDRTLGMGFGFLRGIFIVALLIVAAKMTSLEEYAKDSKLCGHFDPIVSFIYSYLPDLVKQVKVIDSVV